MTASHLQGPTIMLFLLCPVRMSTSLCAATAPSRTMCSGVLYAKDKLM